MGTLRPQGWLSAADVGPHRLGRTDEWHRIAGIKGAVGYLLVDLVDEVLQLRAGRVRLALGQAPQRVRERPLETVSLPLLELPE